jgi:hypothetical protein
MLNPLMPDPAPLLTNPGTAMYIRPGLAQASVRPMSPNENRSGRKDRLLCTVVADMCSCWRRVPERAEHGEHRPLTTRISSHSGGRSVRRACPERAIDWPKTAFVQPTEAGDTQCGAEKCQPVVRASIATRPQHLR